MKPAMEAPAGKAPLTTEELSHMSRLITIGELTACFAHETTNPLMLIRGHLRMIEENLPEDHPIRTNFEVIDRASRRIEDMAKRLLDFSRKRSTQSERCDVGPLINEALGFVQTYIHAQNVEVQLQIETRMPQVRMDRWRIVQALVNLFQNAADAMSQSEFRTLRVRAECEAGRLRITVTDTGHGILPADMQRVFEPFFTTKGERGTGLGLYVTQRVVEEHGGTLKLQNSDRGATFVISLPL